jgi:hypothetical protein
LPDVASTSSTSGRKKGLCRVQVVHFVRFRTPARGVGKLQNTALASPPIICARTRGTGGPP